MSETLIKLDYGDDNSNSWSEPGEVRGVVDGHVVVKRFGVEDSYYQLIPHEHWDYAPFRIVFRAGSWSR